MSLNVTNLLAVLESAQRIYASVRELAADAALTAGPADQDLLLERLASLQAENDAGHVALQAKLAELAKGADNG
jgi:hypothetical protein